MAGAARRASTTACRRASSAHLHRAGDLGSTGVLRVGCFTAVAWVCLGEARCLPACIRCVFEAETCRAPYFSIQRLPGRHDMDKPAEVGVRNGITAQLSGTEVLCVKMCESEAKTCSGVVSLAQLDHQWLWRKGNPARCRQTITHLESDNSLGRSMACTGRPSSA